MTKNYEVSYNQVKRIKPVIFKKKDVLCRICKEYFKGDNRLACCPECTEIINEIAELKNQLERRKKKGNYNISPSLNRTLEKLNCNSLTKK
jgi:hypothetical protein